MFSIKKKWSVPATRGTNNRMSYVTVTFIVFLGTIVQGSEVTNNNDHDTSKAEETDILQVDIDTLDQSPHTESTLSLSELIANNQFESFSARTEAILHLVEDTDLERLRLYWEQSHNIDLPNFRTEVQQIIVQRWAVLDPAGALNFVSTEADHTHVQDLLGLVFLEWSHANVEAAIRAVQDLDRVSKESAVSSIVRAREDWSIERRREIARNFGCEWIAIEALGAVIGEAVMKDPNFEWANFMREYGDSINDLSVGQSQMMVYIAYYWIVQDGVTVLTQMRETLPQSFNLFKIIEFVSQRLKTTQPRLALELVSEFAIHEQEFGFRELGVSLVRSWAEVEPDLALEATFNIEPRSFRRELQQTVLEQFVEPDPYAILDFLADLPEDVQIRAQETALLKIARELPESIISMLNSVPDERVRNRIESAVIKYWASKDIESLLNWIESDDKWVDNREEAIKNALWELARTNPMLALEIATSQRFRETAESLELEVIDWIAQTDLDLAGTLLPNLRAGATRIRGFDKAIMKSIMIADEPELAIELFLQLCELEARGPMLALHLLVDQVPERLFASLDKISSESVKEEIASRLLRKYRDDDLFTDEQINTLQDTIYPLEIFQPRSLLDGAREALDSSGEESEND